MRQSLVSVTVVDILRSVTQTISIYYKIKIFVSYNLIELEFHMKLHAQDNN